MNAAKTLGHTGAATRRGVRHLNTAYKALPEGKPRTTAAVVALLAWIWLVSNVGLLASAALMVASVVALGAVRIPRSESRIICHRIALWNTWAEPLGITGVRHGHPKRTEGAVTVGLSLSTISYDKLKTLLPAIETGIRCRTGAATLTRGSHTHRATLTIRVGKPVRPVYLGPGKSVAQILLGHTTTSEPVIVDGRAHWIIAGRSGSGKSWFTRIVLAAITADPMCQMVGIDLKRGVELGPWSQAMLKVVGTKDAAMQVLQAVHAEMLRRLDLMAKTGKTVWEPTLDAPRLYVPIDEMAGLGRALKTDKAMANLFSEIMEMARAAAIHLIMCVQRPDAENVPAAARANRQITVCLGVETPMEERIVLGDDATTSGWTAHKLGGAGQFYIRTATRRSPVICTALTVPDKMVPALAKGLPPDTPIHKALPPAKRAAVVLTFLTTFFGLSSCAPASADGPQPGENCMAYLMRTHQRCEDARKAPAEQPAPQGAPIPYHETPVPMEPEPAPKGFGLPVPALVVFGGLAGAGIYLRVRAMRKPEAGEEMSEPEHEPMFADAIPGQVLSSRTTYKQGSDAFMSGLRQDEPTVRLIKDEPPTTMATEEKIKRTVAGRLRVPPVSWSVLSTQLDEPETTLRRWYKKATGGTQ